MADSAVDGISGALLSARREARPLTAFPGDLPADANAAYAIQHRSIEHWPELLAGWKVGGVPEPQRERFGGRWLTGPIFAPNVVVADGKSPVDMPVYVDGFAAVEAEYVYRLGATPEEDRLFIGIEIASSPMPMINDIGPAAVIPDFGNNGGLLVGPEIEDWRSREVDAVEVITTIDGIEIGRACANPAETGHRGALAFWRDHASRYGMDASEGLYISSGAVTGVHAAPVGTLGVADFGVFGSVAVRLIPRQPLG